MISNLEVTLDQQRSQTVIKSKKGEWERYDCDKDKGIICDVGIDCGSVSGGTILVGGHNCNGNEFCVNTEGSFRCDTCPDGYEFKNGQCRDINECTQSGITVNVNQNICRVTTWTSYDDGQAVSLSYFPSYKLYIT